MSPTCGRAGEKHASAVEEITEAALVSLPNLQRALGWLENPDPAMETRVAPYFIPAEGNRWLI
jgi:hypothetical protein